MPNIKSAKKRVLVNEKKSIQNKMIRSEVKTEVKKIDTLVKEGKIEEAKAQLSVAFKMIDSAATKGILHRNNASNKKAKLSKKICAAEAAVKATAVAEPVVEPVVVEAVVEEAPKKRTRKTKTAAAE